MHIPDKYRDRYNLLAEGYPWMREMRDEPTNGIDGETNGIRDEITLLDGDAVSILRRAADSDTPMVSLCNRFDAAPLLPSEHSCVFGQLADMVERDYVLRTTYNAACADRRTWFDRFNELQGEVAKLIAERDEWKAKAEQAQESYLDAKSDRDAWKAKYLGAMNDAEDYKTLWQRSRECSTKSAKRAAAVERLKNSAGARFSPDAIVCALLDGRCGSVDWSLECEAILDLLTDDDGVARSTSNLERLFIDSEQFRQAVSAFAFAYADDCPTNPTKMVDWLMAANDGVARSNDGVTNFDWLYEHDREAMFDMVACGDKNCCECGMAKYYPDCDLDENGTRREWLMAPHVDAQRDSNGTRPDAMGQSSTHSIAQSKTEPKLSEQSESLSDAISENHGKSQDSEIDSREKLEADIDDYLESEYGIIPGVVAMIPEWLDRQAAITERECKERVDFSLITQTANALFPDYQERIAELERKLEAATDANTDYRDEWHRVCAERMDLRRELTASKNEGVRLVEELGNTMAERDQWRAKCGAMLDAAQEIRRLADIE